MKKASDSRSSPFTPSNTKAHLLLSQCTEGNWLAVVSIMIDLNGVRYLNPTDSTVLSSTRGVTARRRGCVRLIHGVTLIESEEHRETVHSACRKEGEKKINSMNI
jgi:hypothetical protein